jgi:methyl-accepting chemotaxis protein
MADLGNLNFGIHLKDYTPQEYEAIKKKLVNMHATVSARVGLKTDVKEIEDKVEALLKNKTYKVKLELDSESIKKLSDTFRGQGESTSELRAMRGVSQIMRADAYANSQKALEQLRNARMQAAKASDTHNAAMKRANSTMSSQSRIAGELKNQIANVYSIYTVERFVRGLYTIGGEFQKQRIALTSILGDSMKAETIFNRIKDLAVVSPFQFKELASYTKQLSAYSIPYEELYDTTKRLADISAGVGVDMGRIILAYGQVRSAAFLRGQELRQFTEAGIPLVDELAKRFTILENKVVSAGDVFDKISRKEVSFGMVKDVLWDLTNEGGKFYNMQEALAESLAGKWSNLQDAWDVMMADIAESNSGVLSDSLELLTDLMKHWEAVANILGMLTIVYGSYKTAVILTNVATKGLLAIQTALNVAMKKNPIIWIITLIGSVVGALVMFKEEVKTTAEVITDLNKTIADTNDKMQGNKAVDSLIDRYEALSKKANKSAEESRELGRITKNLANTFKDAVTQTDKYGVAISLSVEKMRKLSQEQKDLYKKQFIGTMANAQIQRQSIDSERERLAGIIREGGYRRFDENGRELSFAKYKPEDITKARNRLLELEKQSLDLANIIDTARQSYHSMSQINISKPLTDWEKEANKLAGDMDALKPKEGDSYEKYMEMLSVNISDLEKKTKAFASGNKYSEKQLASCNFSNMGCITIFFKMLLATLFMMLFTTLSKAYLY